MKRFPYSNHGIYIYMPKDYYPSRSKTRSGFFETSVSNSMYGYCSRSESGSLATYFDHISSRAVSMCWAAGLGTF